MTTDHDAAPPAPSRRKDRIDDHILKEIIKAIKGRAGDLDKLYADGTITINHATYDLRELCNLLDNTFDTLNTEMTGAEMKRQIGETLNRIRTLMGDHWSIGPW
jgi:hypothetical protein